MFMSLTRGGEAEVDLIAALSWAPHIEMGTAHPAGITIEGRNLTDDHLTFTLSVLAPTGPGLLHCAPCDMPDGPAILRLDEVCFPVGAIAHRHTHAGAGIRHLVRGSLRIETDDHPQVMSVGHSWFEPTNTPVRAVALQDQGVTSFVRAMVIPATFAGQSTFSLLDPADADLPRLQVTHRHIDLPIQFEAG